MRVCGEELLQEARSMSRGEYLLIQAAIDFWNGDGNLRLSDLLRGSSETGSIISV